jgi:hypothetical protein
MFKAQDWNERFQTVVKKLRNFSGATPLAERIKTNLNMLHLARDFIFTAQMYGKSMRFYTWIFILNNIYSYYFRILFTFGTKDYSACHSSWSTLL